jgi:hypothetical protein
MIRRTESTATFGVFLRFQILFLTFVVFFLLFAHSYLLVRFRECAKMSLSASLRLEDYRPGHCRVDNILGVTDGEAIGLAGFEPTTS